MIIDMHTHTFPTKIAQNAVHDLEQRSKTQAVANGTQDELLEQMNEAGVDISVIAPVATSPKQVESINRHAEDTCRLVNLGAMHPDYSDFVSELAYLKQKGVKGIKLHCEYQKFQANASKVFGLYEELQAQDMFVLFHAGLDIGLPPPYGGCPDMIREVADKFPKLKIVAAHFGGYKMWDEVLEYLAGVENVWLDTALCAGGMQDHEFFSLYHKHGYEKIMMATDWPWRSAMHTIQWLEQKELKQSELEGILGKNACKLLKLK